MDNFLGMVRDTLPMDNPVGTWQYGRNMVTNKKDKTVTSEDGFSFEYLINGTIIGIIGTNSDIVYFSKNEDGTDEIGVVNVENEVPTYETKIKSSLFNFQYNCPIEGVFIYNYKKELIVAWSDGIKENSNKPFVVNLDDLPLEVDSNKELTNVNEFTKLYMFPDSKKGTTTITYENGAGIKGEALYITHGYAINTTDVLSYFEITDIAYLADVPFIDVINFSESTPKNPIITISNLDTNYDKIKIAFILKKQDGTLEAYESNVLSYENTEITIILDSLTSFTAISPDSLIIGKTVFNKFKTITKQNKEILVGNTELKDKFVFQQYANLLELIPTATPKKRYDITSDDVSFMPDEVYSFYIQLHLLDGTYTDAYHIPGRVGTSSEKILLTEIEKTTYNLDWAETYKYFHIFNNGEPDVKFGYWENVETYPNIDDFNSSSLPSGSDLRGTPIRYHRFPDKKALNPIYGQFTGETYPQYNHSIKLLGVKLTNFNTIVPIEIRNKIQGYKLSFIKRNNSNNLVAGNWAGKNVGVANYERIYEYSDFNLNSDYVNETVTKTLNTTFSRLNLYGVELFKYKPNLFLTHVKCNYFINHKPGDKVTPIEDSKTYAKVSTPLRYIPGNNIAKNTQYIEEAISLASGINIDLIAGTVVPNTAYTYTDEYRNAFIDLTGFLLKENLYIGFKSNDLVTIGETSSLENNISFKGGDVFLQNETNLSITSVDLRHTGVTNEPKYLRYTTNANLHNLYSPLNGYILKSPAISSYTAGYIDGTYDSNLIIESYINNIDITLSYSGFEATSINDITTILTDTYIENNITKFPYRINRSIKLATENLNITTFRTFLANSYYEMPNDKGNIIALRGIDKKLYIQMKYGLFLASIKDTLNTQNVQAFLGQSDLFEYSPTEIVKDDKGYIGSTSQFACIIIKGMYITVNQITGQIFIIQEGLQEISRQGNVHWFRNNWDIGLDFYDNSSGKKERIDNPFVSVGHLVGYDKEYNRLLFTKKAYKYIGTDEGVTFDGEFYSKDGSKLEFNNTTYFQEISKTLSYSLDKKTWQFEHDYFPNFIFNSHTNLYSGLNKLNGENRSSVYKHNNPLVKGEYYGKKFESYVDVIFNQNLSITKLYQSLLWITTTVNQGNITEQFKTIDKIIIYNNTQCSGIIDLKASKVNAIKSRNSQWSLNNFRDLVKNINNPILDENGELVQENINNSKVWFDKSNFISKFIVARFILTNIDNNNIYIHQVNIKSVKSK